MGVHRKNRILTLSVIIFVVFFSLGVQVLTPEPVWAAGQTDLAPDPVNFDPNREELDLSIARTRKVQERSQVLAAGPMYGAYLNSMAFDQAYFVRYTREETESTKFAHFYNITATTAGQGGWALGWSRLLVFAEANEPYIAASFGALYSSSEGLGTFINWQRFQVTAELGVQDFLALDRKLRLATDLVWSPLGTSYLLQAGYAF
jgi:hypothetical protein